MSLRQVVRIVASNLTTVAVFATKPLSLCIGTKVQLYRILGRMSSAIAVSTKTIFFLAVVLLPTASPASFCLGHEAIDSFGDAIKPLIELDIGFDFCRLCHTVFINLKAQKEGPVLLNSTEP